MYFCQYTFKLPGKRVEIDDFTNMTTALQIGSHITQSLRSTVISKMKRSIIRSWPWSSEKKNLLGRETLSN